jgi:levansucrase
MTGGSMTGRPTTAWTRAQVGSLRPDALDRLPPVDPAAFDTLAGDDPTSDPWAIWDSWPIRTPDGSVADVCGHEVWVALAAPSALEPGSRHDVAEHRVIVLGSSTGGAREHRVLGPLFPDGAALGTRQWAGSTVLDGSRVSAFYTAAGVAGVEPAGFRQRLTLATCTLRCVDGLPRFERWTPHVELFEPDPRWYDGADQASGEPGFIKAFRDPFPFVDPASHDEYLLFTASLSPQRSRTDFNGAIGIARRSGGSPTDWEPLAPLVGADGVNNELERPHVVVRDGRYYLFFSTQQRTFDPAVQAPTGLYGFVADSLLGPYVPLNGHGAVFANPASRPSQVYSWLVLDDLRVVGFVDAWGVDEHGRTVVADAAAPRPDFGGTFAPTVRIGVDADRAWLASA